VNDVAVETRHLARRFGSTLLRDLISIAKGEVFGLLAQRLRKDHHDTDAVGCSFSEGTAIVAGVDVRESPDRIKELIGYMSQRFDQDLTVAENMIFTGIYG
jgi:ABC-2 type transport system ATP-binding protein